MTAYAKLLEQAQSSRIDFVYDKKLKGYCVRTLNSNPEMILYTDGVYRKTTSAEIKKQAERLYA